MRNPQLFIFTLIMLFSAPSLASAQIGWTPAKMEAKYGKPETKAETNRLVYALYRLDATKFPTLTSLGLDRINVYFFDGKVVEVFLHVSNLTQNQIISLSLPIIDKSPDKSKIFYLNNVNQNFGYGEFVVHYDDNKILVIQPNIFTPLNGELQKEFKKASGEDKESERIQQELQGRR